MILVVLVALGLLVAAASLVAPVGVLELREGREAFRRAVMEGAAQVAVVQTLPTGWIAATVGAPPGTRLLLPSVAIRPGLVVAVEAEAIGSDLWLLGSRAVMADRGGNPIASSRAGWLLRIGIVPPDSVLRARLVRRPWVIGFE